MVTKWSQHLLVMLLLLISSALFLFSSSLTTIKEKISSFLSLNNKRTTNLSTHNRTSEVDNLRKVVVRLQMELLHAKEQVNSLTTFRRKFSLQQTPLVIPATIVSRADSSSNRRSFKINCGFLEGVELGSLVVYENSLVGRVHQVSEYTSTVLHVTDPGMRIPIVLAESSEQKKFSLHLEGLCKGTAKSYCRLELVERKEEDITTKIAITTGLSGQYPKGLILGKVIENTVKEVGVYWRAHIQPVDINTINTVLVFKSKNY